MLGICQGLGQFELVERVWCGVARRRHSTPQRLFHSDLEELAPG